MRSTRLRLAGTLSVCLFALLFTGCGSNNKGKIEGKWKMTSTTAKDSDLKKMEDVGVASVWDFKTDGTFSFGLVAEKDTLQAKALVDLSNAAKKGAKGGTYRLGMGDRVNFIVPGDNGKKETDYTNVTINGDTMTWKDADGTTMLFVRMK